MQREALEGIPLTESDADWECSTSFSVLPKRKGTPAGGIICSNEGES